MAREPGLTDFFRTAAARAAGGQSRIADDLPCNDRDAAGAIAYERHGELHYATQSGTWHIWDGTCHRPDDCGEAARIVLDFADRYRDLLERYRKQIRHAAEKEAPPGTAQAAAVAKAWVPFLAAERYAAGLRRNAGTDSLVKMLAKIRGCADEHLSERHPRLLNVANGTIDLQTGLLRPHDKADMLTYCLDVAYNPQAACPLFNELLWRMAGRSKPVAAYTARVLGYSLIGSNPEQKVFLVNGPTKSGKSQTLYIVSKVLGPLGHESKAELITLVRHGRNARTENSIRGARLVTITETSEFMKIDEGQLKRLTGEPVISVDQHYAKKELKTPVTWVIILTTNHMPSVLDFDDAMRERIVVIPGGPTIPPAERDRWLAERILASEREGILALLVAECAAYFREGLPEPPEITMETDRYRHRQDTVANFIADRCVLVPSLNGSAPAHIEMTAAWNGYREWARGGQYLGRNEFHDQMSGQPGVTRVDDGARVRRYEGIAWKDPMASLVYGTG